MKKILAALLLAAFQPDPGPNSVNTAALQNNAVTLGKLSPAVQFTLANSSVSVLNFDNCTPTTDGSVDCLSAFQDAIASFGPPAAQPLCGDIGVPISSTPGAYYKLSGPLHVSRCVHIHGMGGTGGNQSFSRPVVSFPAGSNGFIIDFANGSTVNGIGAEIDHLSITSNYAPEWAPSTTQAHSTTVIPRWRVGYVFVNNGSSGTTGSTEPNWNLTLGGSTTDGGVTWTTSVAAGVQMLALASVHDNFIGGFSGNGLHIECSVPTSNCNQWKAQDNFIQGNAGSGIFTQGTDSNASYSIGNVVDGNDAWGTYENSFLGNSYIANEISENGYLFLAGAGGSAGFGQWVGNHTYAASTRVLPTVKNGYYFRTTSGGTSDSSEPSWPTSVGTTVVDGTVTWTCFAKYNGGSAFIGQISGVNTSVGTGNYIEGGQYPAVIGEGTLWMSGANGSGFDSTSTGLIYQVPFVSQVISHNPAGGSYLYMTHNSTDLTQWDTDNTGSSGNEIDLAFGACSSMSNAWCYKWGGSDSFQSIGMTTANTTFAVSGVGTVSADKGTLVAPSGVYFGRSSQRIYSTNDVPGSVGYFGDLSIRDYGQSSTQDGALAYVNIHTGGGQDWARAFEFLQGISPQTATYPMHSKDTKLLFSNYGTSSEVEFDLPSYGDSGGIANYGWWADFLVEDSHGIKIAAPFRSDVIYFGSSVTATNGYIESTTVGSTVRVEFVRFIDAPTNNVGAFYVKAHEGTWTVH